MCRFLAVIRRDAAPEISRESIVQYSFNCTYARIATLGLGAAKEGS